MSKRRSFLNRKKIHDDDDLELGRLLNDDAPFAVREAYLKLCTNIMYLPSEKHCKTIVVTSAIPGEGKTLLSTNIALGLSKYVGNNKVLLIDSDLRRSRINRILGDKESVPHGLSEYLAGIDEELAVSKSSDCETLDIVFAGSQSPNPAGLLSSSKLKEVIEKFEQVYDYIIIDTPPIDLVTDALLYSSFVGGYIISARADYSKINLVNETVNNIHDLNGNVYGVVLNSLNPKNSRRGGYYAYDTYEK